MTSEEIKDLDTIAKRVIEARLLHRLSKLMQDAPECFVLDVEVQHAIAEQETDIVLKQVMDLLNRLVDLDPDYVQAANGKLKRESLESTH